MFCSIPGLCPANAAGNPCRCNAGFTGTLVIRSGRWYGTCTRGTPGTPPDTSPCSNVRREWYTLSPAEQSLYLEGVGCAVYVEHLDCGVLAIARAIHAGMHS
jgi:hypothetical protein